MTLEEIRNIIANDPRSTNYSELELNLNRTHSGRGNINILGFSAIYRFFDDQLIGWNAIDQEIPEVLENSKTHVAFALGQLKGFIQNKDTRSDLLFERQYRELERNIIPTRENTFCNFNDPETNFLIKMHSKKPSLVEGAFECLTGELDLDRINEKGYFEGVLEGLMFRNPLSEFTQRVTEEKRAFEDLNQLLNKSYTHSESTLNDLNNKLNNESTSFFNDIQANWDEKSNNISDWKIKVQKEQKTFIEQRNESLANLEKLYSEKLKLEEPAKYWSERAASLNNQGWWSLGVLVVLVIIATTMLFTLLWASPESILKSFFDGNTSVAVRWSIVFVAMMSFLAFAIRALAKVMFSSFHLARDCQERYTLTYFYLSLMKDTNVDAKDRQLIMQSLFSRAETGLLRDDSSPTMPNDLLNKVLSK